MGLSRSTSDCLYVLCEVCTINAYITINLSRSNSVISCPRLTLQLLLFFLLLPLDIKLQTARTSDANHSSPSILPALAFSLDMFAKTNQSFGVNEVLLSSVLASVVFSVFAAQPLVIVGVTGKRMRPNSTSRMLTFTGPITVFNYTVYDIITPRGTNYFAFMCWIGLYVDPFDARN